MELRIVEIAHSKGLMFKGICCPNQIRNCYSFPPILKWYGYITAAYLKKNFRSNKK